MNKILKQDIEAFTLPASLTEPLKNSVIIVTGATGFIGSSIVRFLSALDLGIRFILPVRNKQKALSIFREETGSIDLHETSLTDFFNSTDIDADYIIHCASPTNGRYMSEHPAETFLLAVESTKAALDYSKKRRVKSMVYVSSIEYYGQIFHNRPVTEEMTGFVDHSSPRSCYPLGKQAAEYLSFSYASEYGVPVKIARLTQTFGAGISPDDTRVFAQFARCAIDGNDITLHTEGKSAKPYCYISDCISALIYILLKGTPGEAYNVATPGTYVTIKELATLYRELLNP
ncbi:MAG: NAD(P)-dependent oxidoreductase, partial [Muribaculaceae bacterium]|nr:NAD(P)-dependent oxidoreductase [Muribaculaceae bacterium]